MKLAVLFTGGKDSTYAAYLAKRQGHELVCLITIQSENPDSYMFHTPAIKITKLQAEAMNLPHLIGSSEGKKEEELADLEEIIVKARQKFEFDGLITGALFSEYQSSRIETIAKKLKLKVLSPLWHKSQEEEMQELLDLKFQFIFTAVAAEGLDKSWLNKVITQKDLEKLNKVKGINLAGEGGEFESLVLDCPLFKKRLIVEEFEIKEESKNIARLMVKKAKLEVNFQYLQSLGLQPSTYRRLPLLTLSCVGHAYGNLLSDFLWFTYPIAAIGDKESFQLFLNEDFIIKKTELYLKNKDWEQVLTKALETFQKIKLNLQDQHHFLSNLIEYYPLYMACIGVYNCFWRYIGNTNKFDQKTMAKIEQGREAIAEFYPQVESRLKKEVQNYPENDLLRLCTIKELETYLSKNKLPQDLKLRTEKYFYFFDGEEEIITDTDVINSIEKGFEMTIVPGLVQGHTAFPGKVTGIVCNLKQNYNLKKGCILVTHMTSPNDYNKMQYAKAIITDEGGLLCHASLLARELKKPCVIGTKIATKVFKDGDLVEVDADKGTVKKVLL